MRAHRFRIFWSKSERARPLREIVLDTETTGFDPFRGDRIVEIGCVELDNHMPTGNTFHVYINPERGMPDEAFGVHGIGPDLLDPPRDARAGEVTLLDKPINRKLEVDVKYVGTEIPDGFVVGYGLDFDEKYRNLPYIGLLKPEFYQ